MTFASEAAKAHNDVRWLVELSDGVSTYRFSESDMVLVGTGFVEGRASRCSGVSRTLSTKTDFSGPTISIIDVDGAVEGYGIARGWTAVFKVGFEDLAYASWETIGTYRVQSRPRPGRTINVICESNASYVLGQLTGLPKIDAGDTLMFTTLDVARDRIGEHLPMYFGAHGTHTGAVEPIYLGFDAGNQEYVWCANASDKTASPLSVGDLVGLFVDGNPVDISSGMEEVNATGNYELLLIRLGIDEMSRFGMFDDATNKKFNRGRIFSDYVSSRATVFGEPNFRTGPSAQRSTRSSSGTPNFAFTNFLAGASPARKLTCNLSVQGTVADTPVDFLEYLLQYHGQGLTVRDSTSYAAVDSQLDRISAKVSTSINSPVFFSDVVDELCQELGLLQYFTTAGKHALYWPLSVSQADASGGFSSADTITDLHDLVGTRKYSQSESGYLSPVNQVAYASEYSSELISDDTAVSTYGLVLEQSDPIHIKSSVLGRSLAWNRIQRNKAPRFVVSADSTIERLISELGDVVKVTDSGGPDSSGWADRLAHISEISYFPIENKTKIMLTDRDAVESTLSAYMADLDDYRAWAGTASMTMTLQSYAASSTDANFGSNVKLGDFIYHQDSSNSQAFIARINAISYSAPTYTVYMSRAWPYSSGAETCTIVSQHSGTTDALCGQSDSKMINKDIYLYLEDGNAVSVFPLNEDVSGLVPLAFDSVDPTKAMAWSGTAAWATDAQFGESPNFTGSNNLQMSAYDATYHLTARVTVACWMRVDDFSSDQTLISFNGAAGGASANNAAYRLYTNTSGNLVFFWEHTGGVNVLFATSTAPLTADKWHFVVATRSLTGVVNLYVGDNDTTPALIATSGTLTMPDGGGSGVYKVGDFRGSNKVTGQINGAYLADGELSLSTITDLWDYTKRVSCSVVV